MEGGLEKMLDPWAENIEVKDYDEQIATWGLSTFDAEILKSIKNPHYTMTRGILFAHRDFDKIIDAINKKKPFVMMTGLMPSGKMHLGHKLVVDQMKWFQDNGGELVVCISDVEAWVARKIPQEESLKIAIEEYITNYLALGVDFKKHKVSVYSQWNRPHLMELAQAFSAKKTFGEMNSIYGFLKKVEGQTDLNMSVSAGKTFFPFIQVADILHPQLESYGGPRPTVVPVGIDQDPHIRLTRAVVDNWRVFNLSTAPEHGLVTVYCKPKDLKDLKNAVIGLGFEEKGYDAEGELKEKVYNLPRNNGFVIENAGSDMITNIESHLKDLKKEFYISNNRYFISVSSNKNKDFLLNKAKEILSKQGYDKTEVVEENGLVFIYNRENVDLNKLEDALIDTQYDLGMSVFHKPASTYNKLEKGLKGGKMSSSKPDSAIYLTDTPSEVEAKVKSVVTGGRTSVDEQRRLGGVPEKCMIYDLLVYNHPSDNHLKETYQSCTSGKMLCGECKQRTAEYFRNWSSDLHKRREEIVKSGELDEFLNQQGIKINGKLLTW
jgi:tryptophanyl-tRNA synthetase